MTSAFDTLKTGQQIDGAPFSPTRESIRDFCAASLDFNPLHLDDNYMQGNFGKTHFGGIIMHGMNNFGVIAKMLTDWLYPQGRSEEHTSELKSLMRISYAVFCLKKKQTNNQH